MAPIGGHAIGARHRAQGHGVLVGPLIPHHAHALHGKKNRPGLPDVVVQPSVFEPLNPDVVHLLQHPDLLGRDVSQDANGQTRPRERMAPQDAFFDVHRPSNSADFVFEQQAQRLHHLQFHVIRQAPNVVVTLDCRGRASGCTHRFDDVGINGPLPEPLGALHSMGSLVKNLNEHPPNGLPLRLGIGFSSQGLQKLVPSPDATNVQPHVLIILKHLLKFVLPQQPVVHENAMKSVANGAVEQFSRDCRIHSPTQAENDAVVWADLGLEVSDGALDKVVRRPISSAPTNAHHEVFEQDRPLRAVPHLGVKLNSPNLLSRGTEASVLHVSRAAQRFVARPQVEDGVAVAHPHL